MTPIRYLQKKLKDEGGWVPVAIAAGASLLGGYLANQASQSNTSAANAQSAQNTAESNKTNLQTAREQMRFQERMSNSAYQRAMADMKKAGLNPILAYQQGGASSPSGASATATSAPVQRAEYQDPLGPAATSAADAYTKTEQIKLGAGGLQVQQAQAGADIAKKAADTILTTQSAKNAAIQAKVLEAQAKKAKLEGDWSSSKIGKTLFELNKVNEAAGGSLENLNSAKQLLNPMNLLKELKKPNRRGHGTTKDGTTFDLETGEIKP